MEFFTYLETIIAQDNIQLKAKAIEELYANLEQFEFAHHQSSRYFTTPSYASFCTVVHPARVPKRRNFNTVEGKVILLHAITHIEYSAIDLALDSAYRFKEMPFAYYRDWIEVAHDEVRHFFMLEALLKELGSYYGEQVVHNSLFEAGVDTYTSTLDRMAIVPRFLEANGLDANPKIIQKLEKIGDSFSQKIIEALHVILNEEIEHVRKGDRWFKYLCNQEGLDYESYFEIVERIYPNSLGKKHWLNQKDRVEAGFSCDELKVIAGKKVC